MMTSEEKEAKYKELLNQLSALMDPNIAWVGNAGNLIAAIQETFKHWWCGIYVVNSNNQLELGPFQGPVACTLIGFGKGVCGTAWKEQKTIVVPDVHQFEGHIACSSASNSEIVVPIFKNNQVVAVLDIDSIKFNQFDEMDAKYLEKMVLNINF
jgi:L-methionine (R)-S-oxide reductase